MTATTADLLRQLEATRQADQKARDAHLLRGSAMTWLYIAVLAVPCVWVSWANLRKGKAR